jgi:tRNA pseudouridine55 synthase
MNFEEGQTLLFNKPKSWTSFDLVKKVRNTIRIKKVGHAGTLDPLATGLMILCTGKHTKQIDTLTGMDKEYVVHFRLGATTASYDAEMPEENEKEVSHLTKSEIEAAMKTFEGEIAQIPPAYSAVHVDGKRAYELARKGKEVELKARNVTIFRFELLNCADLKSVKAVVHCSKGTYIRSLIHDLGQILGVGGYILELERTKIGDFSLENAWELEAFIAKVKADRES